MLRVFLRAPFEFRLRAIMESRGLDEPAAHKYLKERDENSAAYIKQVYGHDWQHPSHYDVVIDTVGVTIGVVVWRRSRWSKNSHRSETEPGSDPGSR